MQKPIRRKYRSQSTLRESVKVEYNNGKSETIPDQSLTIREIMTRFASGTLGDIVLDSDYSEDLPDLRGMDIVEKDIMLESSKEFSKKAQEAVHASAKETRDAKEKIRKEQEQKEIEDAKIVE